MPTIVLRHVPGLVADSIVAELRRRDMKVVIDGEPPPGTPYVDVIGIFSDDISNWSLVAARSGSARIGAVILTDHHQMSVYRRAYAASAAVAHVDSPPAAAVDVITARCRGEILAPARLLQACLTDNLSTLSDGERVVLQHISEGFTVARTAEATFYSERHVRRLLQSILAKAGTNDRREAVVHFRSELQAG